MGSKWTPYFTITKLNMNYTISKDNFACDEVKLQFPNRRKFLNDEWCILSCISNNCVARDTSPDDILEAKTIIDLIDSGTDWSFIVSYEQAKLIMDNYEEEILSSNLIEDGEEINNWG